MEPDNSKEIAPPKPPSALSDTRQAGLTPTRSKAVVDAEKWLKPCGVKTGTTQLVACLTLVAPVGMNADERKAWLAVARETLKGIPEDLMVEGCIEARRVATHPSHIVPAIFKAIEPRWRDRQRRMREALREDSALLSIDGPQQVAVPREITQAILREARAEKSGEGEA